jgi:hypothetical protein
MGLCGQGDGRGMVAYATGKVGQFWRRWEKATFKQRDNGREPILQTAADALKGCM